MNFLYIGQYSHGTTSKMRADILKELLKPKTFHVIDTNIPFKNTARIWRTIGFRFKIGPLITSINKFIQKALSDLSYDIIWVDKGIFLDKKTMFFIRNRTDKLIHFTPDMAFYKNRSKKFENAISIYDYLVTTKTAEVDIYLKYVPKVKLLCTTQGYSKQIHFPRYKFNDKDGTVAFIGLAEPHRFLVVEKLIKSGIQVKLAGHGWEKFQKEHQENPLFKYYGTGFFADEYSEFISSASFGLGLLSKKIPELHTTRTFEIPACGTALLTEKNKETLRYFDDSNAIFYENIDQLIDKITYYKENKNLLEKISLKGYHNVIDNGFDYYSIINDIIEQVWSDEIINKYK